MVAGISAGGLKEEDGYRVTYCLGRIGVSEREVALALRDGSCRSLDSEPCKQWPDRYQNFARLLSFDNAISNA